MAIMTQWLLPVGVLREAITGLGSRRTAAEEASNGRQALRRGKGRSSWGLPNDRRRSHFELREKLITWR